jgi:hypothetical protein
MQVLAQAPDGAQSSGDVQFHPNLEGFPNVRWLRSRSMLHTSHWDAKAKKVKTASRTLPESSDVEEMQASCDDIARELQDLRDAHPFPDGYKGHR